MMTEDPKVVIRDAQWLGSAALFADYGNEEVIVALHPAAVDHPLITNLPDNEKGQSMRSGREAMHLASLAATIAKARGSTDDNGRILVQVEDLKAAV